MKVFAIIIGLMFITSCATVKEPVQKECCKAKTEVTKESCH
jgi:PBP1b-binding outer membrane lipoprotein LpoB|tara:strand:+ start:741 stop:863 length:123 start_codon:yes stop_codon:yes gene_type:complete